MSEIRVGVRDLKARLSEYLRQVKQGHVVVITEHGRPVGRLLPAEWTLEERIKVLQEAGMVAWNGQKLEPIPPVVINQSSRQVSDILVEMRE
jgi:prevent-host-death family protein